MRALFTLIGLLVVVAIVMLTAKKQLQAVAPSVAPAASAAAGGTVQEQSRAIQQQVLQDVNRALQQGAARASDAQP